MSAHLKTNSSTQVWSYTVDIPIEFSPANAVGANIDGSNDHKVYVIDQTYFPSEEPA